MSDNPASWQPDPTGKHDHRYWDGTQWTDNVADAGVAATDPYEAPAVVPDAATDAPATEPEATADPTGESPSAEPPAETEPAVATPGEEPTVVTPIGSPDNTAPYPTAITPPAAPPPYVPPTPVPDGGGNSGSRRGLVIGGVILAAVALVVLAIVAFGGDDEPTEPLADQSNTTTTTTTTEPSDDGPETLDDLRDACADGDFSACDDLYYSADLGSEMETFGSTCGGVAGPQEGNCEATNGGEDVLGSDGLGDIDDMLGGISEEQAECLAEKASEAFEDGELTEEEAAAQIFEYLADCDISLEELGGN